MSHGRWNHPSVTMTWVWCAFKNVRMNYWNVYLLVALLKIFWNAIEHWLSAAIVSSIICLESITMGSVNAKLRRPSKNITLNWTLLAIGVPSKSKFNIDTNKRAETPTDILRLVPNDQQLSLEIYSIGQLAVQCGSFWKLNKRKWVFF